MVVIMFVTVFFFGHAPEVRAVQMPSVEACAIAKPVLKGKLEARPEVRAAVIGCMAVLPADKT